jgi:hypothetical protein
MSIVSSFPDIASAMLFALVPLEPDIRFVTVLPAGDQDEIVARIHRIAGANRDIYIDRPLIDIDVFGPKADDGLVSDAARRIQAHILSFASTVVLNGVIQHANTIAGPRPLPEPNPAYVRYSASYEVQIHA